MTTAKEVITEQRNFFAKLVHETDEKAEKTNLTYSETLDHNSRVAWERALSFALAVMKSEEDGTLDETLTALTSKRKG